MHGWRISPNKKRSLGNDLFYFLVSLPQEIQDPYYEFLLVLTQWYIFPLSLVQMMS